MSNRLRTLLYLQAGALATPFALGLVVEAASIPSRIQHPCQTTDHSACIDVGMALIVFALFFCGPALWLALDYAIKGHSMTWRRLAGLEAVNLWVSLTTLDMIVVTAAEPPDTRHGLSVLVVFGVVFLSTSLLVTLGAVAELMRVRFARPG